MGKSHFKLWFSISHFPSTQAWIEASTKGAVLVFAASEVETASLSAGINPGLAGLLGGMTGGVAQAYATMGSLSFFICNHLQFFATNFVRFHDMYEDSRNYSCENCIDGSQATFNMGRLCGHLSSGGSRRC
jgi:hypothetical protein